MIARAGTMTLMNDRSNKQLSVKQNMLWNSIGCLIYQACQWAMTVAVVVFSSGYDNSGVLAFAMAIGNIYYPLATYNMRTIQVSDVNDEYSSEEYIGFRIVTVILGFMPILVYLITTASSAALVISTLFWLVFKADESFCCVYYAIDQKAMRMDYIGISQAVRGLGSVLVFSVVLATVDSINAAIIAVAVMCICVTVFYDYRKASTLASARPHISPSTIFELLRRYLPAVITLVCYGAVVSVARQQFEALRGPEALGMYAAVATPTVLVQVAASYLYNPLLGGIATKWSNRDLAPFLRGIGLVFVAILAVGFVGVFASELLGESVLTFIYGESIRSSVYLLTPALIATAVTTMFAFMFDILIVMRSLKAALVANGSALLISVFASRSMIELFEANGITYTVIAAFGFGLLICIGVFARRVSKASLSSRER